MSMSYSDLTHRMRGITETQRSCLTELFGAKQREEVIRLDSRYAATNPSIARAHAETLAEQVRAARPKRA